MADDLRALLARIEDAELRDRIIRALERRGEITPQAVLDEIEARITRLNQVLAEHRRQRLGIEGDFLPPLPIVPSGDVESFHSPLPRIPTLPVVRRPFPERYPGDGRDMFPVQPITQPNGLVFHRDFLENQVSPSHRGKGILASEGDEE